MAKRASDDNSDHRFIKRPNQGPVIDDMSGDIHWPCDFCGNHFDCSHDWQSLYGPKGRAYLCKNCQAKWKGENETDKKEDDKKDDTDKKDVCMLCKSIIVGVSRLSLKADV